MTADYCNWFLENYTKYRYVGKEAINIKKKIKRFGERKIKPNPREMFELYNSFCEQYKSDIFVRKTKKAPGIFATKGSYYLIFDYMGSRVPFAYISNRFRISDKNISEIVGVERDKKIKYYTDVLKYHSINIESSEDLLDVIENDKKQFVGFKTELGFFANSLVLLLLLVFIWAFSGFRNQLNLETSGVFGLSLGILGLIILNIVLYFLVGVKNNIYTMNIKTLKEMYKMEDSIKKNIKKLSMHSFKSYCMDIKENKRIKNYLIEPNYLLELNYYNNHVERLKYASTEKISSARPLFIVGLFATNFLLATMSTTVWAGLLNEDVSILNWILSMSVPLLLTIIPAIFSKKVRYIVFLISMISTLLVTFLFTLLF